MLQEEKENLDSENVVLQDRKDQLEKLYEEAQKRIRMLETGNDEKQKNIDSIFNKEESTDVKDAKTGELENELNEFRKENVMIRGEIQKGVRPRMRTRQYTARH